jgi:hypothetical protein
VFGNRDEGECSPLEAATKQHLLNYRRMRSKSVPYSNMRVSDSAMGSVSVPYVLLRTDIPCIFTAIT